MSTIYLPVTVLEGKYVEHTSAFCKTCLVMAKTRVVVPCTIIVIAAQAKRCVCYLYGHYQ